MYTFVTGGYRSGRSNYALRRATELGPPPWLYVSTGLEPDESVRKRLGRQRRDSEAIWRTAVMPSRIAELLDGDAFRGYGAAVLDGVSGWIETRLGAGPDGEAERAIYDEVAVLADRMYRSPVAMIVVSTELGLGPAPVAAPAQRLVKVVTGANQILAQQATAMVLLVSGVPLKLK